MPPRCLTALPVFNEAKHVDGVLDLVMGHADDVLVVDDGSTDGTSDRLAVRSGVRVVTHEHNQGYGAALRTAFDFAARRGYDVLVTIDCDGQHEPQLIRQLASRCGASRQGGADIVSGSRYLDADPATEGRAPADRRRVNHAITAELNVQLGIALTDAFCGFKAYRVEALKRLRLTEPGYAMPLELWVQATHHGLAVEEMAVPLIYLDEERSFGGALDDAEKRMEYYRRVIRRATSGLPTEVASPWGEGGCPLDAATCG